MIKKIRALVLFSGGLDSMLAAKILTSQGVLVDAVTFESNFFSASKARESASALGINLIVQNVDNEILGLVKKPQYGYGKHLNPCLDCRTMMMAKAHEMLNEGPGPSDMSRFDFVASGEVLGQRPFSQNKMALKRTLKISGLEVLRPLCARLLPETQVERRGLVKRELLFDISGRGRDRQIALAHEFGIGSYPSPDGGCLLTEADFSKRFGLMLEYWPDCQADDVALLKNGRPYWFSRINKGNRVLVLAVIGRSKKDNVELLQLARKGDCMVELDEYKGPLCLIRGRETLNLNTEKKKTYFMDIKVPIDLDVNSENSDLTNIFKEVASLCSYHYPRVRGLNVKVKFKFF